ncbi:MAG TPA: polysaccharide biosynthesis C-terminal domain-containing protein [Kribbella sp.]
MSRLAPRNPESGSGSGSSSGSGSRSGSRSGSGSGNGHREAERLARGGALNLIGAIVSGLANLALVVVATRSLGVDDAGRFFTVTSAFLVLQTVARLGADLGLVYFLARFRALGQGNRVGACLRAAFVPVVGMAVLLGGGLALAAGPLARWTVGGDDGGVVTMLRLLAVLLPVAAGYDLLLGITRGYSRMRPTVVLEKIGRPTTQLLAMIAVAATGAGPVALGAAWALPYLPFAVLALRAARRALPGALKTGTDKAAETAPETAAETDDVDGRSVAVAFWRFTAPRSVASWAQILLQRLDIVIVAAIRGPGDAALYAAATRFLVAGQLGNQAISTAVQPRLSALLARKDLIGAGGLYQVSTAWLVSISWPIFGLAAAFAPWLLGVFGDGYERGENVVVLLSGAMLVATACGVVSIVLIMAGKTVWNLWNTLLALVLNIGLDLLLVPSYGIFGAGIGWAAAVLAGNLVPLVQVWRSIGLHPFGAATRASMALSGLCFCALPVTVRLLVGDTFGGFLLAAAVGTAVYVAAAWQFRNVLHLDSLRALGRLRGQKTDVELTGGTA